MRERKEKEICNVSGPFAERGRNGRLVDKAAAWLQIGCGGGRHGIACHAPPALTLRLPLEEGMDQAGDTDGKLGVKPSGAVLLFPAQGPLIFVLSCAERACSNALGTGWTEVNVETRCSGQKKRVRRQGLEEHVATERQH
jgi:hypothetical protein